MKLVEQFGNRFFRNRLPIISTTFFVLVFGPMSVLAQGTTVFLQSAHSGKYVGAAGDAPHLLSAEASGVCQYLECSDRHFLMEAAGDFITFQSVKNDKVVLDPRGRRE